MTKKITTKSVLIIAVYLILTSLSYPNTWAGDATLSWYPTTTDTNGAPLANLAGYKIYYGPVSSTYTQVLNVGLTSNPAAPTYTITNLAAGDTYYFAVTAYDALGNESKLSSEVAKAFAGSITTTTTTTVRPTTSTTTTGLTTTTIQTGRLPTANTLTPNIMTDQGIPQSFTAAYSDPDGWQNLSDATFYIAGGGHDQWLHYSPMTNSFTLAGAIGSCAPGQATALSNSYLILNCINSTSAASGTTLTVTFNLIPKIPFSGIQYKLLILVYDKSGQANAKSVGNWLVYSSQTPKPG